MEQFEKVVKGLELTKSNPFEGWDYHGEGFDGPMVHTSTALIDAALVLIRQQQERIAELEAGQTARLITEKDFEKADGLGNIPAWYEHNPSFKIKTIDVWGIISPENLRDRKTRYWTQRPTEAERKAVKWV